MMHTVAVETVMVAEVVATAAEEAVDTAVDLMDILTGSSLLLSSRTCLYCSNTKNKHFKYVYFLNTAANLIIADLAAVPVATGVVTLMAVVAMGVVVPVVIA